MAFVIRLTRTGKKGERKFRVVVKEKRSRRDGDVIDSLGYFEKGPNGKKDINMERYQYWVSKGAKPSPTVSEIVKG